ncbi:hypothetical protein ILUMI_08088 [Ignelater luminosus]|uniref:Uncharacterized protein n=1 Tax=Ignelater luminosus TaxID=2038154 RepID=A0A8K0D2A0_IGNLU|nr:hypothetical protein ILUMI_08088 [Ignelater luminosus]
MDIEKTTIQIRKQYWEDNVKIKQNDDHEIEKVQKQNSSDSDDEKIPEIKDIYDHIYGNVKSKRVFYESQKSIPANDIKNQKDVLLTTESTTDKSNTQDSLTNSTNSEKPVSPFVKIDLQQSDEKSLGEILEPPASPTCSMSEDDSILLSNTKIQLDQISETETETSSPSSLPVSSPILTKTPPSNLDLLKGCELTCSKCQKVDFINDRSEVLNEINANLKLELEGIKKELKQEMVKNNELNFEIANIESVLETYYKAAKNQKSTLASIYSTMKNYVSENKNDFQESYTYKRIRMIGNYMESLKNKLEHQDKVIKNNFIENPYYTDLMIKHEAILKQLDDLSKENEELNECIKKKASEELETIKELNRQKFLIENKCKEMENYYKSEIAAKEVAIKNVEDWYTKELKDFQTVMDRKDEEIKKIEKTTAARINNYKQELVIVYRKWKEQKMLQQS